MLVLPLAFNQTKHGFDSRRSHHPPVVQLVGPTLDRGQTEVRILAGGPSKLLSPNLRGPTTRKESHERFCWSASTRVATGCFVGAQTSVGVGTHFRSAIDCQDAYAAVRSSGRRLHLNRKAFRVLGSAWHAGGQPITRDGIDTRSCGMGHRGSVVGRRVTQGQTICRKGVRHR